ncbi:hypothetical protein [Agrobacterium tumefaciens]|uniref:hypothetical protein n=1 Tax=Agrobacterium tumefaciens TaxID=358 RepID=UPI00285902A8|nr:hypothetical protein [Agrobacterium tumefaciens]MDR6591550.1 hypothetical protein [Agrobacterium tumefaciens]
MAKNDVAPLARIFAIGRRKEDGASLTPQRHAASTTKPDHAPGLRGKQGDGAVALRAETQPFNEMKYSRKTNG